MDVNKSMAFSVTGADVAGVVLAAVVGVVAGAGVWFILGFIAFIGMDRGGRLSRIAGVMLWPAAILAGLAVAVAVGWIYFH